MHLASPTEGERFFDERWPEARAVSDEEQKLYAAFGLGRGSVSQLLGPRVILSGLRAALRGHGVGKPVGDPTVMSGWFLVRAGQVLWQHAHEHAGAPRQWQQLERAWRSLESE